MTAVNSSDIDYAKGIDYKTSVPLTCNAQTAYTYKFEVTDGNPFESDLYTIPNYLPKKPVTISPNERQWRKSRQYGHSFGMLLPDAKRNVFASNSRTL
jgi:hypothetical protein